MQILHLKLSFFTSGVIKDQTNSWRINMLPPKFTSLSIFGEEKQTLYEKFDNTCGRFARNKKKLETDWSRAQNCRARLRITHVYNAQFPVRSNCFFGLTTERRVQVTGMKFIPTRSRWFWFVEHGFRVQVVWKINHVTDIKFYFSTYQGPKTRNKIVSKYYFSNGRYT